MKRLQLWFAVALASFAIAPAASAQDAFPTRPIKFIVPFTAGSATDALARILGNHLTDGLGQSVIVENIAGASGIVAARNVAGAPPDGYAVFITTNTTHAANQSMFKSLPYDPVNDFTPIAGLAASTLVLVVNPTVPARTTTELIAYIKANPGKFSYGSGSSSSRMCTEMLRALAGLDMLHVPYKSNPEAIIGLLRGEITMMFADFGTAMEHVKAGKLRALAVSSKTRSTLYPELASTAETLPGYDLVAWFAAFGPKNLPPPVLAKLETAFARAIADAAVQQKLNLAGIEALPMSSAELTRFVVSETAKWAELTRGAGIEPQ